MVLQVMGHLTGEGLMVNDEPQQKVIWAVLFCPPVAEGNSCNA